METTWSKAITILDEKGWWQDGYEHVPMSGRVCLWTACHYAAGLTGLRNDDGLFDYISGRVVKAVGVDRLSDVFDWNDRPERTLEEVKGILRKLHYEDTVVEDITDLYAPTKKSLVLVGEV